MLKEANYIQISYFPYNTKIGDPSHRKGASRRPCLVSISAAFVHSRPSLWSCLSHLCVGWPIGRHSSGIALRIVSGIRSSGKLNTCPCHISCDFFMKNVYQLIYLEYYEFILKNNDNFTTLPDFKPEVVYI